MIWTLAQVAEAVGLTVAEVKGAAWAWGDPLRRFAGAITIEGTTFDRLKAELARRPMVRRHKNPRKPRAKDPAPPSRERLSA